MNLEWATAVQYIKRVGPRRAEALAKDGVRTVGDLLLHAPFRYEDRTNFRPIASLREGEIACVSGKIIASASRSTARRRMKIFEMVVRDETGAVSVVFFNQPYLRDTFTDGQQVILYGKAERDTYSRLPRYQLRNPDFELLDDEGDAGVHTGRIVPVYRKLGEMTGKQLRAVLFPVLTALTAAPEPLPPEILKRHGFGSRMAALHQIHFPVVDAEPAERQLIVDALNAGESPAHRRLIYEEFFLLQTGLQYIAQGRRQLPKPHRIEVTDAIRNVVRRTLPFKPTTAQKRVIREIVSDLASPWPMHRLLQGDVGSGKTIVAVQAVIVAVENGLQAAVMAPTEILAEQHHRNFRHLLAHAGYDVVLLKSAMPAAEKEETLRRLASGECSVVVGTHAVIQKDVEFRRLGLAVIDEQHRFGVLQRQELMQKGLSPDILVMTATPIPRTLALTVYGDLALSVIDEMPPGRVPVKTQLLLGERDMHRAYSRIRQEVGAGRQAYVIYPLIEESEKVDLRHAEEGFELLSRELFPDFRVGLMHGRLSPAERDAVMERFRAGEVQVLVSTTVIEVGIDIPNATVMLIQHAERFGLSQLHQLRGRIGRGADASWCLLAAYDLKTEESRRRMEVMVQTSDGFRIAEEDLSIRGPGEFTGTRQSGMLNFQLGSLLRHRAHMEQARADAEEFVRKALAAPDGEEMRWLKATRKDWVERFGLILVG